jgi:2-keto-4-pentenoate hydratase
MPRELRTPRFPFVELLDQRSARYHESGTALWTVYDVVIDGGRVKRAPLGSAAADGRVFVPRSGGKLLYMLHVEARRDLEPETLHHQLASAGWLHLMLAAPPEDPR